MRKKQRKNGKDEFTEVVTNCDHLQNLKFRFTLPYVFTEQGIAMLEAVLKRTTSG
jgi:hypothetical protein